MTLYYAIPCDHWAPSLNGQSFEGGYASVKEAYDHRSSASDIIIAVENGKVRSLTSEERM